jgi:hypothetical protein
MNNLEKYAKKQKEKKTLSRKLLNALGITAATGAGAMSGSLGSQLAVMGLENVGDASSPKTSKPHSIRKNWRGAYSDHKGTATARQLRRMLPKSGKKALARFSGSPRAQVAAILAGTVAGGVGGYKAGKKLTEPSKGKKSSGGKWGRRAAMTGGATLGAASGLAAGAAGPALALLIAGHPRAALAAAGLTTVGGGIAGAGLGKKLTEKKASAWNALAGGV